ncbi:kinase-like domain-containing protein [Mycena belliarum]|uniref:Kinase-like domain-containing protein n=1 Tax=Mycena belliarum TaxID=1033014 RepID=A0AAD6U7R8_9AGAR|nr:kinase-like domain-containing protein [Mycena belliae]
MQAEPDSVWAYLEPLVPSPGVDRIDFTVEDNEKREITFGRLPSNDHVLHGAGISGHHATLQWNGRRDLMSVVTITNHSKNNGTFIDGVRAELEVAHQLFDGSVVCFASMVPVVSEVTDYRYTFHHDFGRPRSDPVFNHYVFGKELGSGRFGAVHAAMEKKSGQIFAVKTAWNRKEDDLNNTAAGQEAMAMMGLEHPHICRLHEVFFAMDGVLVDIVLEYVDGPTLEDFLQNTLTEVHGKELAWQICSAIAFMHGREISHGDIKPDNILVAGRERPMIKVADFGLARVKGKLNVPQQITMHRFAAPEGQRQCRELTRVNITVAMCQQWDSWAVGCLIYRMLCGEHPFLHGGCFREGVDQIQWGKASHCSIVAQDLLHRILRVDENSRILVREALRHPWLAGYVAFQVSFQGISFVKHTEPATFVHSSVVAHAMQEVSHPESDEDEDMDIDDGVRAVPPRRRRSAQRMIHVEPRRRSARLRKLPGQGPAALIGRPQRRAAAKR